MDKQVGFNPGSYCAGISAIHSYSQSFCVWNPAPKLMTSFLIMPLLSQERVEGGIVRKTVEEVRGLPLVSLACLWCSWDMTGPLGSGMSDGKQERLISKAKSCTTNCRFGTMGHEIPKESQSICQKNEILLQKCQCYSNCCIYTLGEHFSHSLHHPPETSMDLFLNCVKEEFHSLNVERYQITSDTSLCDSA